MQLWVILTLTPQHWLPGAGGRDHVPTAASCQVGCNCSQFCLAFGAGEGIIPFSPTSKTGVLFCSGMPPLKEKGKDPGGTIPERSDPVISLPALCSAGNCLPQPQRLGGHRVSCALAPLLWPWLVLALWFLLPGQVMNEGEHFPGHLSWVSLYGAVFILQN